MPRDGNGRIQAVRAGTTTTRICHDEVTPVGFVCIQSSHLTCWPWKRLLWIVCGPQQAQKTVRAARAVRRLGSSDDSASGRGRRVRLRIVDLLTEMLKGISEERGAVA